MPDAAAPGGRGMTTDAAECNACESTSGGVHTCKPMPDAAPPTSDVRCRECSEPLDSDEVWLHAECADEREVNASSDEDALRAELATLRAELGRVQADLKHAHALIRVKDRGLDVMTRAHERQAEAERDRLRAVMQEYADLANTEQLHAANLAEQWQQMKTEREHQTEQILDLEHRIEALTFDKQHFMGLAKDKAEQIAALREELRVQVLGEPSQGMKCCHVCGAEWREGTPEDHVPDCLVALA